tara:strand:- start:9443 stop:9739 length:297 start_codon:yes stop_codon:yes gene_type:complete
LAQEGLRLDFLTDYLFTLIIFTVPLIYSIQPLFLSKIKIVEKTNDKELLKRKKIILYRQIKELEMEYDIGNLNKDDFLLRRSELKSQVSEIIASIKKK